MADARSFDDRRVVVLDTSVVVKWYLTEGEGFVPEAVTYLERHRDGMLRLAAPELLAIELISVLKRRGLDAATVQLSLDRLFAAGIEWHSLTSIASAVADVTGHFPISAYDACFAALANRLDAPFITADRRLARSGACDARLLGEDDPPAARDRRSVNE